MATRAELIAQDRELLHSSMALAGSATERLIPDLSRLGQQEAGGVVRTVATGVVDQFGNVAAQTAAVSYAKLRELGVSDFLANDMIRRGTAERLLKQVSDFAVKPVSFTSAELVAPVVGQTMKKFSQGQFLEAQSFLAESIARVVGNVYRDTQATNSERDPASTSYQRVASATACAFCLVVSLNEYTSFDESGGYHDNCGCSTVPIFRGQSAYRPDYYDEFQTIYEQGRADAGSDKAEDIFSAIRTATGRN